MKISFKKLLTVFMSIVLLSALPLSAAELKPVLKLDDAVQSAFVRSNQVSLNVKEYDLLREQLKAIEGASFVSYQTMYLTKAKNEQQAQIIKDQITYDITNRYNALILLEKEIMNLDASIMINSKKLQTMALQKKLGLVSTLEFDNAQIQLDMQKSTHKAKLEALTNDQNHFKVLTGKDLSKYLLDDAISYEPFRITGSVENYTNNKAADYLKYDKDIVALQADNILQEGATPMPWAVYLGEKYKVDKNLSTLENNQEKIKQGLISSYSTLLSLEEQIATLQNQLKLIHNQLQIAKLQAEVGMITKLDYDTQLIKLQDTDYALIKLITNYNSLKTAIQKPWVSSGGM
ncbi:TolC family protein [Cellulosilyticum sp. I15G10I2]|uniref:TolC family protein n=1 Tax=Cellulosilyticum sp. I15G10I2 TaxID=1892843 RepID=UPI00085C8B08|nr:TolC family protein [Cellulosilyticum sp. I15G10I2]